MTTEEADTPQPEVPVVTQASEGKIKIGEGVLLAVVSAGAYLCAFNYEQGYAIVFQIPVFLISANLSSILIAAATLLPLLIFIQPAISLLDVIKRAFARGQIILAGVAVLGGFAILLGILVGWDNWRYWVPYFATIALLLFMMLSTRWLAPSYVSVESVLGMFRRYLGDNVLLLIGAILLVYLVSYFVGFREAIQQDEFLVANTNPEMVVLRIYGENAIAVTFDRTLKQTLDQFAIIKIGDASDTVFTLEAIGPLRSQQLAQSLSIPHTSPMLSPIAPSIITSTTVVTP